MAILDFRRDIRFERRHFYYFPHPIPPALHHLPRDLACDDPPPSTIPLSRYHSHGLCNNRQHDRLRLCPCVGSLGRPISTHTD